ncbi:DUF624 domain-containing protein [Ectobacillus funiculus]|uniref:YesL family protein n=1 Tax=Ectobacillus funiculus TaxID=137993 RepID=UPI00397AB466
MEMGGLIGGLYHISQWVMRLSITNILWLLFNLPVIYILVNLLYLEDKHSFFLNVIVLIIMLPLIFFPATTAMFGVVRQWVLKDLEAPLFISFLKYYKHNFVRSILGGMIIVPIWCVLIFNFFYYSDKFRIVTLNVFIILAMFLFVITCYFFANTVHMEMRLIDSLKSSVYLCFANVLYTVTIFFTTVIILYVSFFLITFFIPILVGSLFSCTAFFGYYGVLTRVQTLQKQ